MFKLITFIAILIVAVSSAPTADDDKNANVVKNDFDINPDGSYTYEYETSNKIKGQQKGAGGESADGAFSWEANDGSKITLTFIVDDKGYHPKYTVTHP